MVFCIFWFKAEDVPDHIKHQFGTTADQDSIESEKLDDQFDQLNDDFGDFDEDEPSDSLEMANDTLELPA